MLFRNNYLKLTTLYYSLCASLIAYADIDITGGTDHAKDFDVINSLGKTAQTVMFGVASKSAGSVCGFLAILFLAKRRYGMCAVFAICAIAFFASKTLVTNFSNFT